MFIGMMDLNVALGQDSAKAPAVIAAAEKIEMWELAIRGKPFTSAEKMALLDYCDRTW